MRPILRLFGIVPDPERELDEEIAAHLEMTERALRARGLSEGEARAEARQRFGDVRAHRRAMMRLDEGRWRKVRIMESLDRVRTTLVGAARGIRRAPGFSAAVIATLGLGLGANAVMFGVVDRLLLSPPQHVVDADEVRRVWEVRRIGIGTPRAELATSDYLTWPDYEDLLQIDGIAAAAAYTRPGSEVLGSGEGARPVRVAWSTPSFFPTLGVRPALGRFYLQEEDMTGGPTVVVLSHEFWTDAFGADPGVIGRRVRIGASDWEVIGVTPAGFTGAELRPVDAWMPIRTAGSMAQDMETAMVHRNWWWLQAVVRLNTAVPESVTMQQASAAHVGGRTGTEWEDGFDPEARLVGGPLRQGGGPQPSAQASVSKWLAGVSLVVLLIACANVANLLLARGVRLRRELRVRVALGASRGRLLGDLLTQSLLLSGAGAAVALLIGRAGGGALHSALIPNVAFVDTGLAPRLLVFLGVATVLTALLAGVVPAVRASRDAGTGAGRAARGVTQGRTRLQVGLLVAQGALSVVLLIGAGLFVRSLDAASGLDLGYDVDRVVFVEFEWGGNYAAAERADIYGRALDRLRRVPGVDGAATTYMVPFQGSISIGQPRVDGGEYGRPVGGGPYLNKVGDGYFEAMGLSILQGRPLAPEDMDEQSPPVAVVAQQMAEDVWAGRDPIGQCMYFDDDSPCTRVIGVVENHRRQSLVEEIPHHLYYVNPYHPDAQGPPQALMARAADGVRPTELAGRVAEALTGIAPEVQFVEARPLFSNVEPQLRSWRLGASMFTLFGLLALVVAGVGLYSVLAFDVAQRNREMGIRAALGATRNEILAMVVRSALGLTAIGLAVGVVIALGASRFLQPLLFEVSATDPSVYLGVVAVLLGVGASAAMLPGWRATRVDPSEALRSE